MEILGIVELRCFKIRQCGFLRTVKGKQMERGVNLHWPTVSDHMSDAILLRCLLTLIPGFIMRILGLRKGPS